TAGRFGWRGDWKAACDAAEAAFGGRFLRDDGFCHAVVDQAGLPMDERPLIYNLAFALFAQAALGRRGQAEAGFGALKTRAGPQGGYREADDRPWQSNAMMHLFEAAQAWREAGGGAEWSAL